MLPDLSRGAAWLVDFWTAAPLVRADSNYYQHKRRGTNAAPASSSFLTPVINPVQGLSVAENCGTAVAALNGTPPLNPAANLNSVVEGQASPAVAEVVHMRTWNWVDESPLSRVA